MNYFHKTCGYMFNFFKFSLSLKYFIKKKILEVCIWQGNDMCKGPEAGTFPQ